MLHGHSKGFTLLELMIAITITAVMVVIIFGALRIGIRAWEKGEKDVDIRQKQRIVLDLIKRQITSTCMSNWEKGRAKISVKGDHKSIVFASHAPMKPGNPSGLFYVQYAVKQDKNSDTECLRYYERNITAPDIKITADQPDEGDFSELLCGMKSILFEYLKDRPGEEMSLWQKSWDPAVDQGSPRAVRITLQENDEKIPIYVIAGAGA